MASDLLGKTLGNRYRFDELLGVGSFAHVYRITDLNRRAVLAAKVLRREIAQDPAFLARFQREAAVLARLQHPNIVRYYDIVEDDVIFILMDYIPGTTLESILKGTTGPIKPFASLTYLTPLAAALHFAHSEDVIHRDLKPANILIHDNGSLYVTDFGIARMLNVTSDLTLGITIGTPYYMAPEQITGDPITIATDIYALGIILYRMYTGYLPFRGDRPGIDGDSTATRATREQVHADPEPPHYLNPDLDLAVEEIVLRCLEKNPSHRYPSVTVLYDALTEAVGAPPLSLDTASQNAITIEPTANNTPGKLPVPAPSGMKLPEWSQYVPRVIDSSVPPASDNQSVDNPHSKEDTISPSESQPHTRIPVSHTAKTPDRIEHPVPQPVTRPHLEDQLHPPEHVAPPLSGGDRTIPGLGRLLRRETIPPPVLQQATYSPGYADTYGDERLHRNWPLIAAIFGALLVTISVCIATVYLLTANDKSSNPDRDLTKTASGVNSTDFPAPSEINPEQEIDNGENRIAFDSRRNGNFDVFVMNVDGTGLRQLAGTSGAERGPAWSPDGLQIAFYGASTENDNYDIYIINIDGTGLKNLTNSPTIDDKYPTWSPDGSQIAYHSNSDGDYDLYIIQTDLNAADFGPRAITSNDVDDLGPDWSPEGTQIAFHTSQWGDPYEIATLDLATLQVRRMTNDDNTNAFPTWSPDGTRIAYHSFSDSNIVNITLMPTDGSPSTTITNNTGYNAFPDWSPDGTAIVYHSGQNYQSAIYMIPTIGGEPQALTGTQANYLPEWAPKR